MYAQAAPSAARSPSARPTGAPPVVRAILLAGVDTRPTNVHAALVALDTVTTRLRAVADARAVFPAVYGVITRRVAAAIAAGGVFLEPAWIGHVAGRFAERYFDALAASLTGEPVVSAAWRIAFDAARIGPRLPVRDVILGVNAHVNFDLAQGIADAIRAAGHASDARMLARYRHDHDAINTILRAASPEIYTLLLTAYHCPLTWVATRSRPLERMLTRGVLRVLTGWRSQVWDDMLALLDAPDAHTQRRTVADLDRRSGRFARAVASSNPAWIAYDAAGRSARSSG